MRDFESWRQAKDLAHLRRILNLPRFYVADSVQDLIDNLHYVKHPPRILQPFRESRVVAVSLEDVLVDVSKKEDFEYQARIYDSTGEIEARWLDFQGCSKYLNKLEEDLERMRSFSEDFVLNELSKQESVEEKGFLEIDEESIVKLVLHSSMAKTYMDRVPWFMKKQSLREYASTISPEEGTHKYKEVVLTKFRFCDSLFVSHVGEKKVMGFRKALEERDRKKAYRPQLVPTYG